MDRITKKIENPQYMNDYEQLCNHSYTIINKLGKLEDILQSYNVEDLEELDKLLEMATTYEELSKQLGCPLGMVLNLIKETNKLDEHCHTRDIWFDYKGKLISGSFATLNYYNDEFIIEVETYDMFDSNYDCNSYELKVKDYKKTWWLKENKEE